MECKEEKETYSFIRLPKKASLLLDGNERSLFGVMIDYQQMIDSRKGTKENNIEVSISYLVKNLKVTDKTVQKAINKLIQFGLISKQSGAISRKKNSYSINFGKIRELDRLSNDQIFEMRDELTKVKTIELTNFIKPIAPIESIHQIGVVILESKDVQPASTVEAQELEEKQIELTITISEEELIAEFENYLAEDTPCVSLGDKVLKIIPKKYDVNQKKILHEYIRNDNNFRGIKDHLLKALA